MSYTSNYAPVRNHEVESGETSSRLAPARHDRQGLATRPGIGLWTPLCICAATLLCAVIAIQHHLFDSYLNYRLVEGFWTQSRSNQVVIFLATAFKIVFRFSAGVSLIQVTWYSMRQQPLPLGDINALLGGPSIMTLSRTNILFRQLLLPLLWPFSFLPSSPLSRRLFWMISLSSGGTGRYDRYGPLTPTWDKAALIGWPMPNGCSPECITYAAPAIRCTELQSDQIDDELTDDQRDVSRVFQDPSSAYLWAYDGHLGDGSAAFNFTAQDRYAGADPDPSITNSDYGSLITVTGCLCTFYNATHEVKTHFYNGTQDIWVFYLDPLNTTWKTSDGDFNFCNEGGYEANPTAGVPGVSFAPGVQWRTHSPRT
ncbi:hypothetical protein K438DRAFT_1760713 [Mycena galopus ATCC 62051]|nr:hypothetical protein K438DRAFT_1760713 [Mycena galopus ATCC 62051]